MTFGDSTHHNKFLWALNIPSSKKKVGDFPPSILKEIKTFWRGLKSISNWDTGW